MKTEMTVVSSADSNTVLNRIFTAIILIGAFALQAAPPARLKSPGVSDDYLIHAWQTDNGLPQNWVSSIEQTREGYLWIGTRYGGLARFDGVRFVPFNPQNTPELKDVQVEHLTLDETGELWIVMGNESITSFKDGRFILRRLPRAEPRLRVERALNVRSNRVLFAGESAYLPRLDMSAGTNRWELLEPHPRPIPDPGTFCIDTNNTVWFITQSRRVGRFRNDNFEFLPDSAHLPEGPAASITVDSQRHVWLATRRSLLVWTGEAFEDRTPTNGPPPMNIQRIAFSGDGGLWVLERNRLRKCMGGRWTTEAESEQFHPNFSGGQFNLYGDAQGNAWLISYGHGLWHAKSNGTTRLLTEKEGLPSVFITSWFQDSEGNIWIGTAGGIARIRESIFHVLGQAQGLAGKMVRSVCVDDEGELWAGTMSRGLSHWDNGKFVGVPLPEFDGDPIESITVVPENSGSLWIGSINHGLMRLQSGKVTTPQIPDWMGNIRVLFNDSRNQLWVGGLASLFCYSNGKFNSVGSADGFVDGHAIGAMAEDATGAIWIGTGPGELWKLSNGKFTRYTPPPNWPSARFSALLTDTNGVVWIGTLGNGLLCFRDGHFTRYTLQDGLPDNNIPQLLEDDDGNIWAGSYAGIFRIIKSDLQTFAGSRSNQLPCRVYGRFDGLPSLECSSGFHPSCWHSKDGRLWFATANGLVTVNPHEVTGNLRPPVVVIEEILVDGKRRNVPTSKTMSALEIEPGQHYVQFRFTGLNFIAPDAVRFRVKLEGVEGQWQDTDGQRLVGFGPLLPGDYRLRVRACNNDGIWNEKGASLSFRVLPYFWETWWFKGGFAGTAFLALGLVVGLAQRRRYRTRLERLEHQRAVEHERARIAQDLHDDLGTSLTQISMLSALANRDQTPQHEAKRLIEQVRGCARAMVTALDEIVWAVNPKNDSLFELINYLGYFAEDFFHTTPIRCRLDIPDQLPTRPLSSEVRHHLFLAFKEAVNNTARHSGASEVIMRVEVSEQEVVIHVEDNGRGFDKEDETRSRVGNGLINMHKRMEQIGGRADIQGVCNEGSKVKLHLPLR